MAAPGHKKLNRVQRLRVAKRWIASYGGKDPVRGYRKWYGVSGVCAILELRMLGVEIPESRLEQARRDEQARATHRARRNERHARNLAFGHSDETFAFIAGYTEGDAPYGIEWDDADAAADEVVLWRRIAEEACIADAPRFDDDDDLPF